MASKKERNHYSLKEIENRRNANSIASLWFDGNVCCNKKINSFVQKSQFFDQPTPKQASSFDANFL